MLTPLLYKEEFLRGSIISMINKRKRKQTAGNALESGFTLVEILVVLVILGLLGGFLFSKIFASGEAAKANLTKLKLNDVRSKINQYKLMYNKLPGALEDLTQCNEVTGPGCVPLAKRDDDTLVDAWGQRFMYEKQGNASYKIASKGADEKIGGEGVNYDHFIEGP